MRRIRAGSVLVRNPMNFTQVSRVALTPDVVDGIVFWTKDVRPMLPHLEELDARGYPFYTQFTFTPYGKDIERGLDDKALIEDGLRRYAEHWGKERLAWRYDPILLTEDFTPEKHIDVFARMCERLCAYTDTVTLSIVDAYAKVKQPAYTIPTEEQIFRMVYPMAQAARACGLIPVGCCESRFPPDAGIEQAHCIDAERLALIGGIRLSVPHDANQRKGCGCAASVDIGMYDTCINGCTYCYATRSYEKAKQNHRMHDPDGEMLFGSLRPDEVPTQRAQSSNRVVAEQLTFAPEDPEGGMPHAL